MNTVKRKDNISIFRKGFTLIELLVVISIIALLLSILMPSLQKAKGLAKQILCLNNTRQMGIMLLLYGEDNERYPISRLHAGGNTWYSRLTPYIFGSRRTPNGDVYTWTEDEQKEYNQPWMKLLCPAAKLDEIPLFEGIPRVFAYNMAAHRNFEYPKIYYQDGYGLFSWSTGESRKYSDIRHASTVLVFIDSRSIEYIYAEHYTILRDVHGQEAADWNFPIRHPGEYGTTFADGHSEMIKQDRLTDPSDPMWKTR